MTTQTITVGKRTHYLVKTEQGMMDINAGSVAEAEAIAAANVAAAKADVVQAEADKLTEAVKLVSTSDLSKVDKATLEAINVKVDAEIAKEVVDVQK